MALPNYKSIVTGKNNDVFGMPKFLSLQLGGFRLDLSILVLIIGAWFARSLSAADSNWGLAATAQLISWGLIIYVVASLVVSLSGRGSLIRSYYYDGQEFVPMWYARVLTVVKLVLIGIIVYSLLV